jgi:hypothetical protein
LPVIGSVFHKELAFATAIRDIPAIRKAIRSMRAPAPGGAWLPVPGLAHLLFCSFNSIYCKIYVLDSRRRQSRLAPYESCGFGRCFRIASGQTQ